MQAINAAICALEKEEDRCCLCEIQMKELRYICDDAMEILHGMFMTLKRNE